jgi:hypothetical protein
MEQAFNQSVDSEHSRFDHEKKDAVHLRHPKYEVLCSVRIFYRL